MPTKEEQNFTRGLRQSRMAALRQPPAALSEAEETEEEGGFSDTGSFENPGAQRQAGMMLRARRLAKQKMVTATKKAGIIAAKAVGQIQELLGNAIRTGGQWVVAFGAGLCVTFVGAIFGVPLVLLGIPLIVLGVLFVFSGKATILTAKAGEVVVKMQEKKAAAEAGAAGGPAGGTSEAMETSKMALRLMFAPFKAIGCTLAGVLGGFIFLAAIVAGIIAYIF